MALSRRADEYPWETIFADAIYRAEGRKGARTPYGLVGDFPRGTDEQTARYFLIGKIRRWQKEYEADTRKQALGYGGFQDDFITWFGNRYAPTVGATNDPNFLNLNWLPNVRKIMGELSGTGTSNIEERVSSLLPQYQKLTPKQSASIRAAKGLPSATDLNNPAVKNMIKISILFIVLVLLLLFYRQSKKK